MFIFILTLIAMLMAAIFCMYSNFRTEIKAVAIVYLIVATLFVVTVTHNYKGQPLFYREVPPSLIVYGQEIDQNIGYIHILCRRNQDAPLLFIKTPYVTDMHKAMEQGRKKSKGEPYMLKRGQKGEGKGKGKGKGDGDGDGNGKDGSLSQKSESFWSAPMPKPILPRKDTKIKE